MKTNSKKMSPEQEQQAVAAFKTDLQHAEEKLKALYAERRALQAKIDEDMAMAIDRQKIRVLELKVADREKAVRA